MKKNAVKYLILLVSAFFLCSCGEAQKEILHPDFELSYWIDIDLRHNPGRGYWKPADSLPADPVPERRHIANAVRCLRETYGADKLYVVYHRQFEPDAAREVLLRWKEEGVRRGVRIVPTVVPESYATPTTMNFTDSTLCEFAAWCLREIDPDEFGLYDVYVRQAPGSAQDAQMAVLRRAVGDRLVRIGLQPGEELSRHCKAGVEDTWTAECQGLTNELWEHPDSVGGTDVYGRKLLESWVRERAEGETRRIVWDMIPVAWDYDEPVDPLGYVCPGDDALINNPPVDGRIELCHKYISAGYPDGTMTPKFGGYSCDLHILEANSAGKPESPSFYEQLREGKSYTGYFSGAMEQIGGLYKKLGASKR